MKLNELLIAQDFSTDKGMFTSGQNWIKPVGDQRRFHILIMSGQYGTPPSDDQWVLTLSLGFRSIGDALGSWTSADYSDIEQVYWHAVELVRLIEAHQSKLPRSPAARAEKTRFTFEAGLLTSLYKDFAVVIENAQSRETPVSAAFRNGIERLLHDSSLVSMGEPYLNTDTVLFCKDKRTADDILEYAGKFDLSGYVVDGRPKT